MKEKIRTILELLKENKIPVSRVEKELGFSNGLLGKAKETGSISDEKFEALQQYADKLLNGKDKSVEPIKYFVVKDKTVLEVGKDGLKEKPSLNIKKTVSTTNNKINEDFGDGTIMVFGEKADTNYKVVSTCLYYLMRH